MSEKLRVPYLAVGGYVAFVVVSTLLVGLLPPLVNRPICEDSTLVKSTNIDITVDQNKEPVKQINKRDVEKKDLRTRIANLDENHLKNNYLFKKHNGQKLDLEICREIISPEPGERYPWFEAKLPDHIRPINYDVELFVPKFGIPIYDGFITITAEVTMDTTYVLLHSKLDIPLLQSVVDKNNQPIEIECVGEFVFNDFYIIKFKQPLRQSQTPFKMEFLFIGFLPEYESGIFEFSFGVPPFDNSTMLASKFEPIDARRAYPCFDEPRFKASYNFSIDHPKNTLALFNTPKIEDDEIPALNDTIQTIFFKTPPMPTYLIGLVVFKTDDFKFVEATADRNIPIRIWAQSDLIDEGYADAPLNMTVRIFNALLDIMRDVNQISYPPKIDVFAIPDYPIDSAPHFGLPIFKENRILFSLKTVSERDLQTVALNIAKTLSEFWFGNYVTFAWWDELWLQEALGDYIKYKAVDRAYPQFNIPIQFITEELIFALVSDGYPSSHPIYKNISNPYEIEEYFDDVESSKAAAIFRMVENEFNEAKMIEAITAYLNAHPWGVAEINVFYNNIGKIGENWSAKDFFDRWTKQANYPLLTIELIEVNGAQAISVKQSRALNSNNSIFAGELLYPSEYDFVWYVPLSCSFGTGPSNSDEFSEETFYIDTKNFVQVLKKQNNKKYKWVHCDRNFAGYYETDYTSDNWELLGEALKLNNNEFDAEDRANIIHNLFVNAFTERTSYFTLVDVLSYLTRETSYLPWRTVHKHVNDMLNVLDYKRAFFQVSNFFISMMRKIETDLNLWSPGEFHLDEMLKETIIDLACRVQDSYCLNKVTELWQYVKPNLLSLNFNTTILPPFSREVIYNYHFQNTYDLEEWTYLFSEYILTNDLNQQRKYLEALTYTRLPWLIATFIKFERETGLRRLDTFEAMTLLAKNPTGREIVWDYFRINFNEILEEFGLEDPRIGRLLLDVSSSFENEFMFYELLEFVFFTPTGSTGNARFKALEVVSTNIVWLADKEEEIIAAFEDGRKQPLVKSSKASKAPKTSSSQFIENARKRFQELSAQQKNKDN